jgi:hypothetical protein
MTDRSPASLAGPLDEPDDVALLGDLATARRDLEAQIARRVVGQHAVVEQLLTAMLAGGHALLVGVPGWPRRCSCRPSRARSPSTSAGCSSRPT